MVNPVTVNLGIIVPLTGADVDTWGEDDVNPNMVALDGLIGGVQTLPLSNVPVTLTAPAGFTATPSPGPTQSQNRVLKFTGTLTADVLVTLPLPGVYVVDYSAVSPGAFVTQLRAAGAGEVIALPTGSVVTIYCDGLNVRFTDLGKTGDMEFWAGISSLPRWVASCTKQPFLPADGTTLAYNVSDYPALGARMGGAFGGNGITTFGIPDLSGRFPLAYDRTGARITTAGSGLNGQSMGAVNGSTAQSSQLTTPNLPPYTPAGTNSISQFTLYWRTGNGGAGAQVCDFINNSSSGGVNQTVLFTVPGQTFSGTPQGGISQIFSNVPPAQVSGIWAIKT